MKRAGAESPENGETSENASTSDEAAAEPAATDSTTNEE
jgi:hypothetical protein